MFPPLFRAVAADAAVRSVFGTNPTRVWPFAEAPKPNDPGASRSVYAVWQVVGGSPENFLAGVPDVDGFRVQVDTYADTLDQARAAARALRDALEPVAYVTAYLGELREPDTRLFRVGFLVDFLTPR